MFRRCYKPPGSSQLNLPSQHAKSAALLVSWKWGLGDVCLSHTCRGKRNYLGAEGPKPAGVHTFPEASTPTQNE